jgi:hypothetical protein
MKMATRNNDRLVWWVMPQSAGEWQLGGSRRGDGVWHGGDVGSLRHPIRMRWVPHSSQQPCPPTR